MSLIIRIDGITDGTNDARVICCSGKLSYGQDVQSLAELITELLEEHHAVLLDFSEVTAMDGGALGAIVVLYSWAQSKQARVAFCCPPANLSDFLKLPQQELLPIHGSREQALHALLAGEVGPSGSSAELIRSSALA